MLTDSVENTKDLPTSISTELHGSQAKQHFAMDQPQDAEQQKTAQCPSSPPTLTRSSTATTNKRTTFYDIWQNRKMQKSPTMTAYEPTATVPSLRQRHLQPSTTQSPYRRLLCLLAKSSAGKHRASTKQPPTCSKQHPTAQQDTYILCYSRSL